MALKTVITSEEFEGLDDGLRSHYIESQAGGYVLDAGDLDQHPKVLGLRNTLKKFQEAGGTDARRLKARLEEADRLRDGFGDLDPEEVRTALTRLQELEATGGKPSGDDVQRTLQDALAKQAEKLNGTWEAKVSEKDAEINHLRGHIENRELSQGLTNELKGKVLEGTEESVGLLLRAKFENRVVWDEIHGERMPRGVFVNDLGEEVNVATFVETWLRSEGAKPFVPGSGNNGTGSKADGPGSGRTNPFKAETRNLTEQGRIFRENPALAKQLAAAAGVTLAA